MIDLKAYLYKRVKEEMDQWNEEDIYAISFFVHSNEESTYGKFNNVTDFSISYNTEHDCEGGEDDAEERWNYAYWVQDEIPIIDTYEKNEGAEILFQWYKEEGIENIGYEEDDCYDDACNYIGKGPVGYYELLTVVSRVAKRLQNEKYIINKFGKPIPIIVHDLEYAWYEIEATKNANPNGEADLFFEALSQMDSL
jgi:hypothetical protein